MNSKLRVSLDAEPTLYLINLSLPNVISKLLAAQLGLHICTVYNKWLECVCNNLINDNFVYDN